MKACTFFGHRNITENITDILKSTIDHLIINENVDMFYMGNQGTFDSLSKKLVCELSEKHKHIKYNIVLAYRPTNTEKDEYYDFSHTIIPEEVAASHPRYAIVKRNKM